MNIFKVIGSASEVFKQGKAIKGSTFLTNVEAAGAMLFSFLSAVVVLLNDLGVEVNIGGSDIHTVANGWAITVSAVYGIYRIATNPATGIGVHSNG